MSTAIRTTIEIGPGEFYLASEKELIRTLLGSCVAVTLWHAEARIGAMCHYMLPSRSLSTPRRGGDLDARYADEALTLLVDSIRQTGNSVQTLEAKIFGGGNQFPDIGASMPFDVPRRNVDVGLSLLSGIGLQVSARQVGGTGPRVVILDTATGEVLVRNTALVEAGS